MCWRRAGEAAGHRRELPEGVSGSQQQAWRRGECRIRRVRDLDHCIENLNFSEFDEAKTTSMASSFGGEAEVKTVFSGVGCFGALWCL